MSRDLAGQRVLVVGLGRSGRAAAVLAHRAGGRVVGIDLRQGLPAIDGVTIEGGPHRWERFAEADLVVVSPGVPPTQPDLARAVEAGTEVIGELAFAASFLDVPMVAITGTNGKSTVTSFTGALLRAAGRNPFVGGNLGSPLCNAILEPAGWDCAVVEISSYQLERDAGLHPRVGVILNLTPDHLARHGTMDGYAAAKARLFRHMGPDDLAILPHGDARLAAAATGHRAASATLGALPGVVRDGRRVQLQLDGAVQEVSLAAVAVPGSHNLDNAATACLLAVAMGARAHEVAQGLPDLRALPHRMEVVPTTDGLHWINDSKATNVDAARAGIAGLDQPAVVLLGGQAKADVHGALGFAALASVLQRHRAVLAFGGDAPKIAAELAKEGVAVVNAGSLEEAVASARALAVRGDAVLLSPGCASFDAFADFEHRGRAFAQAATRSEP